MRYVVDSSVAFKCLVPEIDSDLALGFRAAGHDLHAPDVFPVELAHALTRAERQGRIRVGEAVKLWDSVMATPPAFHPSTPLTRRAIDMASAARIGVYDCLYVTLAEQEGCEFVTADAKLIANLIATFPFVVALADVP